MCAGRTVVCLSLMLAAAACAYPRKATPLHPLPGATASGRTAPPAHLWHLQLVALDIPSHNRGGRSWDPADEGQVDPFVRLFRGEEQVWQSEPAHDDAHPRLKQAPAHNLRLPPDAPLRVELWDDDDFPASDRIGVCNASGLLLGGPGGLTTLKCEGGATATFRVTPPIPHMGPGIAEYEVRRDALRIVRVLPHSPASRAELRAGDAIIAIEDRNIRELGSQKATSELAMAAQRQSRLRVQRGESVREVTLDRGYTWLFE